MSRCLLFAGLTTAVCLSTAGCAADRADSSLSPEEMLARAASTPVAATFEFDTTPGVPEGRYAGAGFMSGDDFEAELRIDNRPDVIEMRKVGSNLYSRWDDGWAVQEAKPGLVGTGFVGPRAHLDFLTSVTPIGDLESEVVEGTPCHRVDFEFLFSSMAAFLEGVQQGEMPEPEGWLGTGEAWIGNEDGRVRRLTLTLSYEGDAVFSSEYSFRDFDRERAIEAPPDAVEIED